jgi:hypothetical protein
MLRMRFAPQTTLPAAPKRILWERLLPRQARDPELRRRAAAIWWFVAEGSLLGTGDCRVEPLAALDG